LKVVLPVKVVFNQNGFVGPAAGKFRRYIAKNQKPRYQDWGFVLAWLKLS
jgi:hypothetical protein